jgi:hypothetical protein
MWYFTTLKIFFKKESTALMECKPSCMPKLGWYQNQPGLVLMGCALSHPESPFGPGDF